MAVLRTGRPGRCLAIRADIDALPIREENELDYRSCNEGVMHACGHDAHTAMLIATAVMLKNHEDELKGKVKLIPAGGRRTRRSRADGEGWSN